MTARIVLLTERLLTLRKRRRVRRREKRKRKSPLADWTEAILSAVLVVLLINQYLLQAYVIPSPSMVPTLQLGDRLFVNKLVYGPELVPGSVKLPGYRAPARGDVIIFESPDYRSRGPVADILQRMVYMVTLSLVDIDKGAPGEPKHFLIKRAVGMGGDRITFDRGELRVMRRGESTWVTQDRIQTDLGAVWTTQRLYDPSHYDAFRARGVAMGLRSAGLAAPEVPEPAAGADGYYLNEWSARTQYAVNPAGAVSRQTWRSFDAGISIGLDELLPLGDNRDNSEDGRYFGPVKLAKVLGHALLKYWPPARVGPID